MANLYAKIGEMEYDGLITGLAPQVIVGGGTLAALDSGTAELKRGTILAKDANGKLAIMNTGLNANCVLCDDVTLGTSDLAVTVYTAGCFDPDKTIVATGYTLTESDRDTLRTNNIYFKAAADV